MTQQEQVKSLFKTYEDYFSIGTCLEPNDLQPYEDILVKHFNSLTAENCMKPVSLQPEEGKFKFDYADQIIDFAEENNKMVRGHTLVWHNQTPDWFFEDGDGNPASREQLIDRMKKHITKVVKHYEDDIYCWDVVNEAIEDSGSEIYRQSKWIDIVGEDFIELAFKHTAQVAPNDTALYYNDYNAVQPKKRDKIIKLVKDLKKKNVPVDGIGIQGHWNIEDFSVEEVREAIDRYAKLDVDIQITELDISMFSFEDKSKIDAPTKEMKEKQIKMYKEIFEVFREYSDVITNVTLWGIADDNTWLDNFPVRNRKNWPLLFDVNRKPKEALVEIINDAQ